MAEQEIKRVNFFNGQFLKQEEFLDLDSYHLHMRRRWAYVMFGQSGVVQDLTIGPINPNDTNNKTIRITAGMAIGQRVDLAECREIVLLTDQIIDLSAQGLQAGDTAIITIHHQEVEGSPSSDGGVTGNTRIAEQAIITIHRNTITDSRPDKSEPFVTLGALTFDDMKPVSPSPRQMAYINDSLLAPVALPPIITLTPNTLTADPTAKPVTITVGSTNLDLSKATAADVAIDSLTDITGLTVTNPQTSKLTLSFTLAANASPGIKTITITVSGKKASANLTVQAGLTQLTLASFAGVDEPNNDLNFKIKGNGFTPPVTVAFTKTGGGFTTPILVPQSNVTSTQINIPKDTIPPEATIGPVQVQSSGQPPITSAFDVVPPASITDFNNKSGSQNTSITITGSQFFPGTTVGFGGGASRGPNSNPPFPLSGVESLAPGKIVVLVPSGAKTGQITITNGPDGQNGGTVQSAVNLTVS